MRSVLALKATTNQIQISATTLHFASSTSRTPPPQNILKAFHCEYAEFSYYILPGVMKQFHAQFGWLAGNRLDGLNLFWMTFERFGWCFALLCFNSPRTSVNKMIITKKNRRIIYENLFKGITSRELGIYFSFNSIVILEGVLVAKKDFNAPKHEELDVPNLQVIKALQSLTSSGYVKTQFSWQWYYYVLTPEGVEYLREWYVSAFLLVHKFFIILLGSIFHPKLYPPHTKKLFVLSVLLLFVLEVGMVHIAHLVEEIVTDIAVRKMKAHQENIDHNSLVWVGVLLGSSCWDFFNLVSLGARIFFFYLTFLSRPPSFCRHTLHAVAS